ncbi:basic leucine zipper 4-like [Vigna radiata var. radiata]|uniref:Basic leucine zipper 4-like n=2 Tax=Vigna TaxID=3913 RepID=A0A1S3UE27_VIGRR|nr:basic leucine zipper 4-like [Vigna radiata var. radiata]
MFFHEEAQPVHSSCFPLLETMFTPTEIEELFSLVNKPLSPESGSQESNRVVRSTHERKLRRMQSNRESARRSRWRKKRHLENLTNQANRLRMENRELKNRLCLTMHQNLLVSLENERLRSESVTLMATLSNLYQILATMISQQ